MKISLIGFIVTSITYLIGAYILDSHFGTPWINFIPFHIVSVIGVSIFVTLFLYESSIFMKTKNQNRRSDK
jgi:putative Mn2+ efflux pump MntP